MSSFNPIIAQSINRTLSEAREVIQRCLQTNNIPMLWGASGIGKTEKIEDLIASLPKTMGIVISLGSLDALDFTGVPSVTQGHISEMQSLNIE